MVYRLTAISALLWLTGCATQAGFAQMMDSWVGSPEAAIIQRFGAPQSVYTMDNGDKVITYHRENNFTIGGGTYTTPVTTNTTGYVGSTPYNSQSTTYVQQQQPGSPVHLWCDLSLTISHGQLGSWSASGNHCVAKAR